MDPEELAWMRRVGVVVRRDAKRGAPVEVLDRIAARFRSGPSEVRG
jgi:hypothetical protein